MAGKNDIEAGSAFIRLYVKDDDVEEGLQRVRDDLSSIRSVVDDVRESIGNGLNFDRSFVGTDAAQQRLAGLQSASKAAMDSIAALRQSAAIPVAVNVASSAVAPMARMGVQQTTAAPQGMTDAEVRKVKGINGWTRPFMASKAQNEAFDKMVRSHSVGGETYMRNLARRDPAEFMRMTLQQQQQPAGMAPSAAKGVAATMPATAAAPVAKQATAMQATTQAITAQAKAVSTAAATVAAPVQQTVALAQRLRVATSAAGSAMMGIGMRIGMAGAAIAAIALPLKMVTDRFGQSAVKVKDYADKYGVSIDEAIKKTNSALTANQVKLGVALAKSWSNIKSSASTAWDSVAAAIGAAFSPQLTERAFLMQGVAKSVEQTGKMFAAFAANNQPVVSAVLNVTTAAAAMGAVVVGAGTVISVLGANLTVLGGVAAALMSPMALATAAVVAGGYAWTQYTASGKAALKGVVDTLKPFVGIASDTMAGVQDAIVAGDLAQAWNVASAGMRLAAATGFDMLTELAGGRTQEAVSAIVGQLLSGDITGAWNTTVLALSAVWDNFAAGFVSTFSGAAKAVVDAWSSAVQKIANMLLEQSAAGGISGAVATAILGVDMAEQQRISDELDAKLKLQRTNVVEEAKKDVARNMGATSTAMKQFIDSLNDDLQKQAAETNSKLDSEVAGASDKNKERIKEMREELDKLRKDAKAKADEVRAKGLADVAKEIPKEAIKPASATFGTFSAAAAMAAGTKYNSPAERMAKDVAAQKKLQEDQLKVAEKTRDLIDKLQLQWTA